MRNYLRRGRRKAKGGVYVLPAVRKPAYFRIFEYVARAVRYKVEAGGNAYAHEVIDIQREREALRRLFRIEPAENLIEDVVERAALFPGAFFRGNGGPAGGEPVCPRGKLIYYFAKRADVRGERKILAVIALHLSAGEADIQILPVNVLIRGEGNARLYRAEDIRADGIHIHA